MGLYEDRKAEFDAKSVSQLITWGIASTQRDASDDFAHTFVYHVYGNDGQNLEKYEGTITLDRPETLNSFSSLSEDQLIASIKAKLGSSAVTTIENDLKAKLTANNTPPTVIDGNPWNTGT